MFSKKYLSDYGVEYDQTRNGRIRGRPVYIGKHYIFAADDTQTRATAKLYTILSLIGWVAFLPPLFFQSAAARTSFIMIPHACALIPLLGITSASYCIWTVKQPMKREQKDQISLRTPRAALLMTFFSGVALAGFIVKLFLGESMSVPGDIIFGVCEALLLVVSILAFSNRRRTATKEIEGETIE